MGNGAKGDGKRDAHSGRERLDFGKVHAKYLRARQGVAQFLGAQGYILNGQLSDVLAAGIPGDIDQS